MEDLLVYELDVKQEIEENTCITIKNAVQLSDAIGQCITSGTKVEVSFSEVYLVTYEFIEICFGRLFSNFTKDKLCLLVKLNWFDSTQEQLFTNFIQKYDREEEYQKQLCKYKLL